MLIQCRSTPQQCWYSFHSWVNWSSRDRASCSMTQHRNWTQGFSDTNQTPCQWAIYWTCEIYTTIVHWQEGLRKTYIKIDFVHLKSSRLICISLQDGTGAWNEVKQNHILTINIYSIFQLGDTCFAQPNCLCQALFCTEKQLSIYLDTKIVKWIVQWSYM